MEFSVCVFGDSVAKGVIFDSVRRKYLFLKENFAESVKKALRIDIVNYSKFGCTITKGKEILHKHLDELSKYAYVALEFGGNDCDFHWEAVSKEPEAEHLPKTPLEDFERIYSEMIHEIHKKGGRPVLFTLPPIHADRYFKWISHGKNAANLLKWLGDVNRIYRWHELYSLSVLRIAEKFKLPLVDIRRAFLEYPAYGDLICEDGIHPNANGHLLISDTIAALMHNQRPAFV